MSEMLMEDYIREQINKGQYGVIVIPISTAEDIAYYIETSRDKTESVRHGKWIGKPIAGYSTVRCSECGDVFLENNGKWEYCPNCGCKMDLDEVNDE